jgi:hypothetical protein
MAEGEGQTDQNFWREGKKRDSGQEMGGDSEGSTIMFGKLKSW